MVYSINQSHNVDQAQLPPLSPIYTTLELQGPASLDPNLYYYHVGCNPRTTSRHHPLSRNPHTKDKSRTYSIKYSISFPIHHLLRQCLRSDIRKPISEVGHQSTSINININTRPSTYQSIITSYIVHQTPHLQHSHLSPPNPTNKNTKNPTHPSPINPIHSPPPPPPPPSTLLDPPNAHLPRRTRRHTPLLPAILSPQRAAHFRRVEHAVSIYQDDGG